MAKWSVSDMGLEYYNPDEAAQTPMEMVKQFVRVSGQEPDAALYGGLIVEEYGEWWEEVVYGEETPVAELKELTDLLYVIYGYANAKGWDIEEAFRRVHANNMGRMCQPDGTIKRREDGKIEKNKEYPKVKLEDLV
jgi:NTP pyrophosphatase (non-canonical NTP hydrolase)